MKKLFLGVLLVCFMFTGIFAEVTDIEIANSGNVLSFEQTFDYSSIGSGNQFLNATFDDPSYVDNSRWNDDILVMSHGVPTGGKLSTDVDITNGDIYVSLLVPHSGYDDTVYTYKSTDGGMTWNSIWTYGGNSVAGEIIDQKIIVGEGYFFNFVMFDGSGSNSSNGLFVHAEKTDFSNSYWVPIIPGGDSLANFSVDRNIETPAFYFIAYSTNNGHIRRINSSDTCNTWGNAGYVSNNGSKPSVAAGGDGYVYIASQDTTNYKITVLRYTNNQVSPSIKVTNVDSSDNGIYNPTVAAERTAPGDSQVAWLLYSRTNSSSNKSIRTTYTTDGGNTWATPGIWGPVNQTHDTWNMIYPYARVSYDSYLLRAVATIRENSTNYDSLVYAYSTPANPDTWDGRIILNEHRITGEFGAVVSHSDDCLGGYIVYREYGSSNIWFDAFNWNGIRDKKGIVNSITMKVTPNPVRGKATLYYSLTNQGLVKISLYDMTGVLVRNVYNGSQSAGNHSVNIKSTTFKPGVYFIRLETDNGVNTKSITVLK